MPGYRVWLGTPGIYMAGHPKGQQVVEFLDVQAPTDAAALAHVAQVVVWPPRQAGVPFPPHTVTLLKA